MDWLKARSSKWLETHALETNEDWKKYAEHLGMSVNLLRQIQEEPPSFVAGIDEVGYGAYAGPLVVGAVLSRADWNHPALRDSKEVKTVKARENLLLKLQDGFGAGFFLHRTPVEDVDRFGIFKARLAAFAVLVEKVQHFAPSALIVIDGNVRLRSVEHVCLPKADSFVPQVMAASIIAKVFRDTEMISMAKQYPQYGFEKHKGYGGNEKHQHVIALKKYGPCPLHRRSFRPIRELSESSTSGQSGS